MLKHTGSQCAAQLLLVAVLALGALLQHTHAETRICLNMIAKDEADEILKALEPLVDELSGWTLCDTGVEVHRLESAGRQ